MVRLSWVTNAPLRKTARGQKVQMSWFILSYTLHYATETSAIRYLVYPGNPHLARISQRLQTGRVAPAVALVWSWLSELPLRRNLHSPQSQLSVFSWVRNIWFCFRCSFSSLFCVFRLWLRRFGWPLERNWHLANWMLFLICFLSLLWQAVLSVLVLPKSNVNYYFSNAYFSTGTLLISSK